MGSDILFFYPPTSPTPSTLYTLDANETAIRALIAQAVTAGGHWQILLPDAGASGILLSAPLPLISGISYIGKRPLFYHSSSVPDNDITFYGGTWFRGDGTFPCFQAQTSGYVALDVDKAAADANFSDTGVKGVYLINIGISNFSRGISAGAKNQMGLLFSEIHNVFITACASGWGVYMSNFQHCWVNRVKTFQCLYGQNYMADVPSSVLQPGNSTLTQLFDNPTSQLSVAQKRKHRGIVLQAGANSNLNEIMGWRLQVNNFSKSSTIVTAISGGTSFVQLPAGSGVYLEPGMPVKITNAGGNGNVTTDITAFVHTVSGDYIRFSSTRSGSAILGSFTAGVSFTTYGFGNFEVLGGTIGVSGLPGSGGTVTNCTLLNLDLEGVCQTAFLGENMTGCFIGINELYANPSSEQHIVLRKSQPNYIHCTNSFTSDVDGTSVNSQFFGSRDITNSKQNTGQWFGLSATSSRHTLGLGSADVSVRGGDLEQRRPSGGQFVYPLAAMGQRVHGDYGAGTGSNINAGQAGLLRCTTSGASTIQWNLPTIDSHVVGLPFKIINGRTGGGSAYLNLVSSGAQYINGITGKNTINLAPVSGSVIGMVDLMAFDNGSGTYYWVANLEPGGGATIP